MVVHALCCGPRQLPQHDIISTSTCESGNNTHFPLPIISLFAQCWEILKLLLKLNDISFLEIPRMTVHQKKNYWHGLGASRCAVTGGFTVDDTATAQVTGTARANEQNTQGREFLWLLSKLEKLSPQNCFSFQEDYCDVEFCSPIVLCKTFVEN